MKAQKTDLFNVFLMDGKTPVATMYKVTIEEATLFAQRRLLPGQEWKIFNNNTSSFMTWEQFAALAEMPSPPPPVIPALLTDTVDTIFKKQLQMPYTNREIQALTSLWTGIFYDCNYPLIEDWATFPFKGFTRTPQDYIKNWMRDKYQELRQTIKTNLPC